MTQFTKPTPVMGLALTERLREMRAQEVVINSSIISALLGIVEDSLPLTLVGFEGEGGDDQGTEEGSEEGSEEGDEEGSEEGDEEGDDPSSGLKKALQKERQQRRETAKQLKALQKQIEDNKRAGQQKEEDAERQAREKETAATNAKLERLAAGYRTTAVDTALARALQDPKLPKFLDSDDVLRMVDRANIDVDQDDDDPVDVVVDEDDVKRAIKQLAKKKPHLLVKSEEGEGEGKGGSGGGQQGQKGQGNTQTGKFNGKGNGSTPDARKQDLMSRYPALRNRR